MTHRRLARVLASLNVVLCLLVVPALAQAQTKTQQGCILGMNKAGTKLAATQGKENSGCVGAGASGKLLPGQDVDQCISADNKGKIGKGTTKTSDTATAKCTFPLPPYGFAGAAATNAAGVGEEKNIVHAVYGNPVAPVILTGTGGACQSAVTKAYEKFAAARGKAFVGCKTAGYKLSSISNAAGLVNCIDDDPSSKVSGARTKIKDTIDAKCAAVSLSTAFPGCAAEAVNSQGLADCVASKSECHMCLLFEQMDAIDTNCDVFDDGAQNQSCRQCLNGATEAPEQCDDGAESLACDTDCTFASCGDGKVNATRGETCDTSGQSAACDDDCTAPVCTDGNLNESAGEVCDDGNNTNGDGCDNNCKVTACGNGIVTAGEACDDGNNTNGDGCDNNCKVTACGNGIVTAGETCDDGNLTNGDGCDSNCTLTGCGNGIVTAGEACDSSGVNTAGCDSDCTLPACHDGHLNTAAGEACDDGNLSNTDTCVGACLIATCGDGFLCSAGGCHTGPGAGVEQCDNDGSNSNVTPNACRTTCKLASCGDNVVDAGETCDGGGVNTVSCDSNCTSAVCGDGFVNSAAGEACDGPGETASCDPNCTTRVCGDGYKNVTAGEQCDDGNTTSGDLCSSICHCGPGSGEIGCPQDLTCPNKGELTLLAGTGDTCINNGDCLAGTCSLLLNKCVTASELDTGWTGAAHDSDVNDNVKVSGRLLCSGPGPLCGQCLVLGLSPDFQNCRCNNNSRTVCDKPFAADVPHCGATNNTCNCYFGAPLPLSSGNTPACAVNQFAQDISGTANVDTGAGLITAKLKSHVYLATSTTQPCPTCGGTCTAPATKTGDGCAIDADCDTRTNCTTNADCPNAGAQCIASLCYSDGLCGNYDPTPGDGVRGGTCFTGPNDGQSCDIMAPNRTFPAPGGGGLSLDCYPGDPGSTLVSGANGLQISLQQTTGSASLPSAALTCALSGLCPCGECSGDITIGCRNNADCTGVGTCAALPGLSERPNACSDSTCTATGGGEGECAANVPDKFCDAVVRANGEGFISCQTNADCDPANLGIVAGACALTKQRECFLNPVTATGVQDANKPLAVTAFCIGRTSSPGINSVAGLPGPGRIKSQAASKLYCANNPANLYTPGVGCP